MFKKNLISPCNYDNLVKIGWNRASRTDKKVSAAMNVVSCKLHCNQSQTIDTLANEVESELPDDIKIIEMIEVNNSFDAKKCSSNREYHYILPSFCLQPSTSNSSSTNYKISDHDFKKLNSICHKFVGTKNYHNFTKNGDYKRHNSLRTIREFECCELIEIESLQYVKFKLTGQSFLYNQIRKMIGLITKMFRESHDDLDYLERAFTNNKVEIPKAPAEGLYLNKVDYSQYNKMKLDKKNGIEIKEENFKRVNQFNQNLITTIHNSETKDKIFSLWLDKIENDEYFN